MKGCCDIYKNPVVSQSIVKKMSGFIPPFYASMSVDLQPGNGLQSISSYEDIV